MAGAKTLFAKNSGNELLAVKDIWFMTDRDIEQKFKTDLNHSLETQGMVFPVLVCSEHDWITVFRPSNVERRDVPLRVYEPYRCLIGANRIQFAKENGYDKIEVHIVKTVEEFKKLLTETFIEPSEFPKEEKPKRTRKGKG